MTRQLARGLWLAIGLILIVVPVLPLSRWSGAPDVGPPWVTNLTAWALGTLMVVVVAVALGRLAAGQRFGLARIPFLTPWRTVTALAVLLTTLSACAMLNAFAGNPHLIDEVAQLFQSRVFAAGQIAAPAPVPPESFLIAQTLITDAGWISQYPPGQSVFLAMGMVLGAEWLVNPVLGGVGTVLVFALARGLYGPRVGLAAALLWAASSWVLFMSATYMNHVGATTLALGAWALLWAPKRAGRLHLVAAGLLLAATAATRPLDGVAATLPVTAWLIAQRRVAATGWLALGTVPVALVWGYLNWRLVGSPVTLGYTAHYGSEVGLGFHADPWGRPYTPFIAAGNLAAALRRLHIYFYEWPIPALLPLALWSVMGRQWSWKDLVVAVGVIAGPLLYLFYWHSGFYPGPRFYYIAAPFIAVAFARCCHATWRWARRLPRDRFRADIALVAAAALVLVWGWVGLLPQRWDAYRDQLPSMKLHPERELAAAGVDSALVVVSESWGSRIIARLWGMGAPVGLVERVYGSADACDLHRFAGRARAASLSKEELVDSLAQMLDAEGPQPQSRPDWPDPSLRLRPGVIPAACLVEMRRDLEGFTIYGSLAWRNAVGLDAGIVFAREVPELNDALFARYRGWPIWRYAPTAGEPESPPVLRRVNPPALPTSRVPQ